MQTQEQEIQLTADEAKENIEFGKAIERLENSDDFKLVIGKRYFEDYLKSAVQNKAHSAMSDKQAVFDNAITGIGNLMVFLELAKGAARGAELALIEAEEALEEIRNEED